MNTTTSKRLLSLLLALITALSLCVPVFATDGTGNGGGTTGETTTSVDHRGCHAEQHTGAGEGSADKP